MKKMMSMLVCLTLAFSLTAPLTGEAKSRSGGSKSYKSSSNSYKSSGTTTKPKSSTTTKPKTGTGSNSSTGTPATTKPKSGTGSNTDSTTSKTSTPTNKSYVPSSYLKRQSPYKTPYYKPTTKTDYSKYNGKSYYNPSSGFASTLLTAAGVYLILDSFSDNGEPVYIDSETGEPLTQAEVDAMQVEAVEVQEESAETTEKADTATKADTNVAEEKPNTEEEPSSSNTWMWVVMGILFGIIIIQFLKKSKR